MTPLVPQKPRRSNVRQQLELHTYTKGEAKEEGKGKVSECCFMSRESSAFLLAESHV